jgi:lysophospholipase L1-like esterase
MQTDLGVTAAAPRRWRRSLLALILGSIIALVAAELGYRSLRASKLGPTTNPAYVTHDADLGWGYRPGTSARHRSEEFDTEVSINSRGFRGKEWPSKSSERPRVLVLGDSFAFGWGVEAEETFAARLAELEPQWDVFNAGVSGYGTDQELLLLRRLRPELEPDLVVCLFCPNDLFESSGPVAYGRHKPYFALTSSGPQLRGSPVPQPLLQRVSHLWRAIVKHRWEQTRTERADQHTRDWELVRALYIEMLRELDGVPLLVLSENSQLERLAERSSLHHLDLRPVLSALGEQARYPMDGHFTPAGHEVIARELLPPIRDLLQAGSD